MHLRFIALRSFAFPLLYFSRRGVASLRHSAATHCFARLFLC